MQTDQLLSAKARAPQPSALRPQPSAHQRQLPLVLHESRKLVVLNTAMSVYGCDEDSAVALIETGAIPWAFDISSGDKLREIRVVAAVLRQPPVEFKTIEAVIDHIVPEGRRGGLRASELRAWWDCGQDTIKRLVKNGKLTGHVNGHTLWINADSAREFLKRRRIT